MVEGLLWSSRDAVAVKRRSPAGRRMCCNVDHSVRSVKNMVRLFYSFEDNRTSISWSNRLRLPSVECCNNR
jgi:hypothetical protein